MNLKKFLQKQAEKDAESLLNEEDKLFIEQLIQKDEKSERQEKSELQDSKKD